MYKRKKPTGTLSILSKHIYLLIGIRVFRKLGFQIEREDIESIVKCENGAIERVLRFV
jgi:hypothetical protein